MILNRILPIEFDKLYYFEDYFVLTKNNRIDFLEYYIKKKKMRFNKITYENSFFLRYQKIDKKEGWIDPDGVLYDDE